MGYDTRFDGEIRIGPPLTWIEFRHTIWSPTSTAQPSDRYRDVKLRITEEIVETDEGSLTRRYADAAVPLTEERYRAYDIIKHVSELINTFPDHTFTGRFDCEGEDVGDMWRLVVKNGRAQKVVPHIVWPDEEAATS